MARHVCSQVALEDGKHNAGDSNPSLLNDKYQQAFMVSCAAGAKSAICDCLIYRMYAVCDVICTCMVVWVVTELVV